MAVTHLNHLYNHQSLYRVIYNRDEEFRTGEARAFAQFVATKLPKNTSDTYDILEIMGGDSLHRAAVLDALKVSRPKATFNFSSLDNDPSAKSEYIADVVTGKGIAKLKGKFDFVVGFFLSLNSALGPDLQPSLATTQAMLKHLRALLKVGGHVYLDYSGSGPSSAYGEVLWDRSLNQIPQPCKLIKEVTLCEPHNEDCFLGILDGLSEEEKAKLGFPASKPKQLKKLLRSLALETSRHCVFNRKTGVVSDYFEYLQLTQSPANDKGKYPVIHKFTVELPFSIMYTSETHAAHLAQLAGWRTEEIDFGAQEGGEFHLIGTQVSHQEDAEFAHQRAAYMGLKIKNIDASDLFLEIVSNVLILSKAAA